MARQREKTFQHVDNALLGALVRFAERWWGAAWHPLDVEFENLDWSVDLALPWATCTYPIDGKTVLERYVDEERPRLTRQQRSWVDAQRTAWCSICVVERVLPGQGLRLRDLLTRSTRQVVECDPLYRVDDVVLVRLVDIGGDVFVHGNHVQSHSMCKALHPILRRRFALYREAPVAIEQLRKPAACPELVRNWEAAVADRSDEILLAAKSPTRIATVP